MNTIFQERLNELLSKKLYTYEALTKKLGLKSKGTITKYANGQIKNPSISTIEKIAKLYNISPAWLSGLSNNKYANMNTDEFIKIKIVNQSNENSLDSFITITSNEANNNDYIALIQKDNSLSPEILKNDHLLIKCIDTFNSEDFCAINYKNEILIRKIIKTDIGLILKPTNAEFEPIVCLNKDIKTIKILGIVKKVERFFN